jgi:uncharacterized protein DUF6062
MNPREPAIARGGDSSGPAAPARNTPRLPINGIGDVELADALTSSGCPLCRVRHQAASRYLESLLWENVNDTGFRKRLATGRGFCRIHVRQLLKAERVQSGGSVGAAILFAASLRVRLAEIERLPSEGTGRSRAPFEQARRQPQCPACEAIASSEAIAAGSLVDRVSEPSWRAALGRAELCLDDLLLLWSTAAERHARGWPEVAAAQVARIRDLAERLESFAHHSSYDRLHLLTDDERRASDEVATLLGDSPARPKTR